MLEASILFIVTMTLIIWQPRGLQVGTSAILGAMVAVAIGIVSLDDVITVIGIVWDATLAFIGIILLSIILDEIGFFEWSALWIAKLSQGSGRLLFVNTLLLGALVSALFANDGAALILTPILIAKMKHLRLNKNALFAFLIAGGFIGDSASNPLIISNLTNIVTADYFDIGFVTYAKTMLLPNILSIIASIVVLWIFFHKDIPKNVPIKILPKPSTAIKNRKVFHISWIFLVILMASYFYAEEYHLPVSIFALGGALIFLGIATLFGAIKPVSTIKSTPWQIVWFAVGLYIVVYGLKNAGLTAYITEFIDTLATQGKSVAVVGTGFLSAILSSIMNNMPTVMIMDIAISDSGKEYLAFANILGCNLGPKMTPVGSLATLLWLHILNKNGITITWWQYMKVGVIITPPVLFIALLGLL